MIQRTCDTLRNASHLILLAHMLTWTDTEVEMEAKETANADKAWWPYTCEARTQFQRKIYPLLLQVQERGRDSQFVRESCVEIALRLVHTIGTM